MQSEAVQLFMDRAVAVQPSFKLTSQNAAAVVQLCQQLDGLPLAIELAAARVTTLTVEQIAARLDDRFNLLTMGSRTAMPRHQTLRGAVDWSHELLTEKEQIFSGGYRSLQAAGVLKQRRPFARMKAKGGRMKTGSRWQRFILHPSSFILLRCLIC